MPKSYRQMSYTELLTERERILIAITKTKSKYLKTDYNKYLKRIEERLERNFK